MLISLSINVVITSKTPTCMVGLRPTYSRLSLIKTIMHFTFQILVIFSNLGFICLYGHKSHCMINVNIRIPSLLWHYIYIHSSANLFLLETRLAKSSMECIRIELKYPHSFAVSSILMFLYMGIRLWAFLYGAHVGNLVVNVVVVFPKYCVIF